MAGRKIFPTRIYEIKRLIRDFRLDRMLNSRKGRKTYWNGLKSYAQHDSLTYLLESTLHLSGDVIECGVFRGGSLMKIARTISESATNKKLFGLDSFEGFPRESVIPSDVGQGRKLKRIANKFRLCNDVPSRLNRIFKIYQLNAELVPGYFSNTLPRFSDHQFCFIHLDCDIYTSYKECLETLYDRLTPGGVIVFDEWQASKWPGADRAISEFFADREEEVQTCTEYPEPSHFIRKAGLQPASKAA